MSASGLRALRYAREVEGIGQVVALDNDKGNFNFEHTCILFDINCSEGFPVPSLTKRIFSCLKEGLMESDFDASSYLINFHMAMPCYMDMHVLYFLFQTSRKY